MDHTKTNLIPEIPLLLQATEDRLMVRRNKNNTDESSSQENEKVDDK